MKGGILHVDCPSGIAGDMFVAAALDLGVPREVIEQALHATGLEIGWEIKEVKRGGVRGKKVYVDDQDQDQSQNQNQKRTGERGTGNGELGMTEGHEHVHGHGHEHVHGHEQEHEHGAGHSHRHYRDIRKLLDRLPPGVRTRAYAIFDRIAKVESALHGVSIDDVAFHEVGAIDSIFDVVAAAAALDWLAPKSITCARVPLGGGTVMTAHGRLPVPAPATAALLIGVPVESGHAQVELTTPTGAAILAASVDAWREMPSMSLQKIGHGAGERELPDRPNLVRLLWGEPTLAQAQRASTEPAQDAPFCIVEANLDDFLPEFAEPLMEVLFAAGAVDVWFTPIHMKKNRPAFMASALASKDAKQAVVSAFLRESTSLGVRITAASRCVLERRIEIVETRFGAVEVKLGLDGANVVNIAPEYESVRRAAAQTKTPIKIVHAAALAAASTLYHR